MSWAEEDWTVGLSGKVLQKVKDLQVHHERLSRENKQKQLLLDNIQASLEKQTAKFEKVRVELQSSHRELQRVQEEAQAAVTSKERLSQDLQSKQAQVCSLEGQLDAARTLNNKLTQEVKRLEAELEKLQNSGSAAETTLFSTPCWSSSSPWESSGSKKQDRHGNREEGKTSGLHVRRLQFSDMPSGSLPRQQPRGTHHVRTPDVYSTPSAAFPWERDETAPIRQSPESPTAPHGDGLSPGLVQELPSARTSAGVSDALSASELRSCLASLEEELRIKGQTLNTVQNEVAQNKKELAAKQLSLQKLRDELSLAHTRMAQEGERASAAEQKTKQLQEELRCQRQNADSSRLQHQQKTKELEKQHQRDLQEFQKERQFTERQHQQEINKLNQELAQARALHNALQAQMDKVSLQKQALEKELDSVKEKLKWTEGQLQQSQKQEAQTQAKLTEAVREAETLTVSLKQSQKKERALEEDGRRLTEERDHSQCLLRELQEQKATTAAPQQTLLACPPAQTSLLPRKPSPATAQTRPKRDEVDQRDENTASYPTAREPGEGIDSEHIRDNLPSNSECARSLGSRIQSTRAEISENDAPAQSKSAISSTDHLRAELRDVREELQKRLDDLEVQRRAETEARTRLKQLSRKNASQEEQYKECRGQLEKERGEVERLRKAVAALETDLARERREKTERKDEEGAQEKEDEMIELNMQLKKQLSEVKAQLVLEREERSQLEETHSNEHILDKKKIEQLESEIQQLKVSPIESPEAQRALPMANSPVTYLTLREDELNSNVDKNEEPETLSFCESTNKHNAKMSLASGRLIQREETALMDPQHSLTVFTNIEQQESNANTLSENEQDDCKLSALAAQIESLQKQNVMEKDRANQSQIKLELLQNQVTQQTQQLTTAFERQSQHISGLLAELQEKENTISSTEQELEQCKQQLKELKGEMETGDQDKGEEGGNDRKESTSVCIKKLTIDNYNSDGRVQSGSCQEINIISSSDSALQEKKDEESPAMSKELKHLQQENLLLKLKIAALTKSELTSAGAGSCGDFSLRQPTPEALSDGNVQTGSDIEASAGDNGEHGGGGGEGEPEAESQRPDQICHLQRQVEALQTKLEAVLEENRLKAEELSLWRLSASEELQQQSRGCLTLSREDELLISCSSNKLQGRPLSTRLQHKASSENKTAPFPTQPDRNEDNSESDKENTSPSRLKQRMDGRDFVDGSTEVKTSRILTNRAAALEVRSVSTQTESSSVFPGPLFTQTEEEPEEELDSPSVSPVQFAEGLQLKDSLMLTASFPIPADPASLAERIRRNRTQLSAAFDDTEYEPYGLPEVVMKGFADIPTGPSCPYIVRRGLLGTSALPVPQKNSADSEETD